MRYYLLFTFVTLASFAFASVSAALAVCAAWPRVRPRLDGCASQWRTHVLFALRALPSVAGLLSAGAVATGFLRHEPRHTTEEPGIVLCVAAVLAAGLVGVIAVRGARDAVRAVCFARLAGRCRQWTHRHGASISVVETGYPVAAVAGMFRPRLLMSSRILSACTPEELDAIVAHEQAHIRAHHNVVRAVMLGLPDPLAVLPTGREIEAAWALAAEETADDEATGLSEEKRAALAATLLHVARMADDGPPSWMPALAFYQGHDLQHRVRALLDAPVRGGAPVRALPPTVLALALAVLAWSDDSSGILHRAVEWMVRSLP